MATRPMKPGPQNCPKITIIKAARHDRQDGPGSGLFLRALQPGKRGRYPWADLCDPLPRLPPVLALHMRPRMPPGWPRWEPAFAHIPVRWAWALAWQPGPGDVSGAELALDYEAFIGRVLPPYPHYKLQGTRLPRGERAQVLHHAARLVQQHMASRRLL